MKITIELTIARTEGGNVNLEDVTEAICEEMTGYEFEAGDEPSVFEIQDAEVSG